MDCNQQKPFLTSLTFVKSESNVNPAVRSLMLKTRPIFAHL